MPVWVRRCGIAAIGAALPTVVWRVVVGFGADLGTPASWRRSEDIPGSGTTYVVSLSALQLIAALLTVVLFVPDADRVRGHRFPRWLVVGTASVGATVLTLLCVLSAVKWSNVDPFRDATAVTGWALLCWTCYAAALLWPAFLVPTIVGYHRSRAGGAAPGTA